MKETEKLIETNEETNKVMVMSAQEEFREKFMSDYTQLKHYYNGLKAFNTKIEAYQRKDYIDSSIREPKHNCPYDILREQQSILGQYLHILELRAVFEGINLGE